MSNSHLAAVGDYATMAGDWDKLGDNMVPRSAGRGNPAVAWEDKHFEGRRWHTDGGEGLNHLRPAVDEDLVGLGPEAETSLKLLRFLSRQWAAAQRGQGMNDVDLTQLRPACQSLACVSVRQPGRNVVMGAQYVPEVQKETRSDEMA